MQRQRKTNRQRRLVLYALVPLCAALCALFMTFTNWRVNAEASDRATTQKALFERIDTQVAEILQARIDAAKKAESDAKANADE